MVDTPSEGSAPTRVRYLVLMWLCLAATVAYIQRNSMGVVEEDMRADLGLSKQHMGWLMGSFFLTYALLQIPCGRIGDWWGTRIALPFFALIGAGMMGLAGLWPALFLQGGDETTGLIVVGATVVVLWISRLGMGAAQAGLFPCSVITIGKWFPPTQRALPNGALGSFMSIGSAVGAALTGLLVAYLSWPWLFVLYFFPGVVWAVWFWLWFRDRPEDHPAVNDAEVRLIQGVVPVTRRDEPAGPIPWEALLTSPAMLWICAQQFFRAAGYMFFASWFPTFLKETRGVSTAEAGVLTSLPFIGVVLGSLAGGAVSDWIQVRTGSRFLSRQVLAAASVFSCALLILAAWRIDNATIAVIVISLGAFLAAMAGPCAYTITIDLGGRHVATVFSTMNMCGNLGAMAFPVVVPWLVEVSGSWNIPGLVSSGWDWVLIVFAGIYVAAGICWLMLNARQPIFPSVEELEETST